MAPLWAVCAQVFLGILCHFRLLRNALLGLGRFWMGTQASGTTKVFGLDGESIITLEESESINFLMSVPTIGVGSVLAGHRIVQAVPKGVRVYEGCTLFQEFLVDNGLDFRGLGAEGHTVVYVKQQPAPWSLSGPLPCWRTW